MGRIDLNRDGIRVTDVPQGGAGAAGYSQVMQGTERAASGAEGFARGVRFLSDSLSAIADDMADTRNRQEYLEAQTAMFDMSNEANQALEESMLRGEFDGAGGVEKFKQAAIASQKRVEENFAKWADKNVSQADTRAALRAHFGTESARNFAHLSGRFRAYDEQRRYDMMMSQCQRAILDGDIKNLDAAIEAYCGNGRKSEEFKKRLKDKMYMDFYERELKTFKDSITVAETVEDIDSIIQKAETSPMGKVLGNRTMDGFNLFAFAARNDMVKKQAKASAEREANAAAEEEKRQKDLEAKDAAEAKALENARKKEEAEAQKLQDAERKAAIADANDRLDLEAQNVKNVYTDALGLVKNIEDLYKQVVDEDKLTVEYGKKLDEMKSLGLINEKEYAKRSGDFAVLLRTEKAKFISLGEAYLRTQAVSALEQAKKDPNGSISPATLKDARLSAVDAEAQAKIGEWAGLPENEKADYRRKFFEFVNDAFRYKSSADKTGAELADMLRRTQEFFPEDRKSAIRLLDSVFYGKKPNDKWTPADVKAFQEEFAKLSDIDEKTILPWRYASDPARYNAVYDRVYLNAKIRGLNYAEAIKELREDPFYKQILLKKNRAIIDQYLNYGK